METYFQGFHEDDQFSTNLLLSNVDDLMKDQLEVLEDIKTEENDSWVKENYGNEYIVGKEDFQQIMSDWYQHIGPLQSIDTEDLSLGLDVNLDTLNNYPNNDLFEEIESPVLSKALKYPEKKKIVNVQPISKLAPQVSRDSFLENLIGCSEPQNNQKVCGFVKTEPNFIRKFTLVNGEKEILGKNIIGLHCLNEIQENPDENCQVTSTVINGKRYKIIIKPKSLKVKKLSEEKIRKTLIKKLMQRNLVTKTEAKEDEIISEMCNGNYDVPILTSDLLPSWDFSTLDSDWSNEGNNDGGNTVENTDAEPIKKVPPIRIKVPKSKKHKKKSSKSDEEIDVEGINDEIIQANSLSTLLKNFEEEVAKLERNEKEQTIDKETEKISSDTKNIRSNLPKEMIDRIEALKRKKDRRISLIQAMPTKKVAKSSTRMQDAVATMNRNKLIKIVSGGDAVQMDHDYCGIFVRSNKSKQQLQKSSYVNTNLAEKNPKKDSGMESGDVSDASEGPTTPESTQNASVLQFLGMKNNKKTEESVGDHVTAPIKSSTTSPSAAIDVSPSGSDSVKTKTVSNGNKALTNNSTKPVCVSDSNNTVPSEAPDKESCSHLNVAEVDSTADDVSARESPAVQNERPKKKLKLEEYLNRKLEKEKKEASSIVSSTEEMVDNSDLIKSVKNSEPCEVPVRETVAGNIVEKQEKTKGKADRAKKEKDKKYWRDRNRSSSASSGERSRKRRRRSRSNSRSFWRRSCSNSSTSRRKRKQRMSEGVGRRKRSGFWSGSLSRSSSRESSTSSDWSSGKSYKNSSRYRRRSSSRSLSRGRSRSRNRGYSKRRCSGIYYHNRNFNNARSPFYGNSMREKQRQIEERRVIYVGRIEEGMTNSKLRERFSVFGPIIDISLHFREYGRKINDRQSKRLEFLYHYDPSGCKVVLCGKIASKATRECRGDNYGFVTYAYKADAYDAIEHGNDDPSLPHYDLCFGGRRGFCKEKYADLDGMPTSYSGFRDAPVMRNAKDSFDLLLKEAQAKLKNRKKQ